MYIKGVYLYICFNTKKKRKIGEISNPLSSEALLINILTKISYFFIKLFMQKPYSVNALQILVAHLK